MGHGWTHMALCCCVPGMLHAILVTKSPRLGARCGQCLPGIPPVSKPAAEIPVRTWHPTMGISASAFPVFATPWWCRNHRRRSSGVGLAVWSCGSSPVAFPRGSWGEPALSHLNQPGESPEPANWLTVAQYWFNCHPPEKVSGHRRCRPPFRASLGQSSGVV
jgi:hypothetical protein